MNILNKDRIKHINYINKMEKGVLLISDEKKAKIRQKYVYYYSTPDEKVIKCQCYSCIMDELEKEFNKYEMYYLKEHTKLIKTYRFNLNSGKEQLIFDKDLFKSELIKLMDSSVSLEEKNNLQEIINSMRGTTIFIKAH